MILHLPVPSSQPAPTGDDMPVPPTGPTKRLARVVRRDPVGRALAACSRYSFAAAVTLWATYWADDVHVLLPGLAIAAMLANPWRPKTGRPRVPATCPVGSSLAGGVGETRHPGASTNPARSLVSVRRLLWLPTSRCGGSSSPDAAAPGG